MKPRGRAIAAALIISSFSDNFSEVIGAISALHAIDNACIITFNAPFFVSNLVAELEIKQVDITRKCAKMFSHQTALGKTTNPDDQFPPVHDLEHLDQYDGFRHPLFHPIYAVP